MLGTQLRFEADNETIAPLPLGGLRFILDLGWCKLHSAWNMGCLLTYKDKLSLLEAHEPSAHAVFKLPLRSTRYE